MFFVGFVAYNYCYVIKEIRSMKTSFTKHIFMSYSRKDELAMRRIVTFLRKQGINMWVDNEKLIPGTPIWEVEIEKAIKSAVAVVVLLSPEANSSVWVRREISFAERYHKRIFPVLIAGDEDTSIMLRLSTNQYVDIREKEELGLNFLFSALSFYLDELDRLEEERKAAERLAKEKADAERKAREEAEWVAKQKAEEERIAKAKLEAERLAKEKEHSQEKLETKQKSRPSQAVEQEASGKTEETQKKSASPRATIQRQPIITWAIIGILGLCVVATGGWAISYLANLDPSKPALTEIPASDVPAPFVANSATEAPVQQQQTDNLPTLLPTKATDPLSTQASTATNTPVTIPAISKYFREEFDTPLSGYWDTLTVTRTTSADPDKVTVETSNGKLVWDFESENVYYYLFYNAYTYDDVQVSVRADNRGRNNNSVSLICRYDPEVGWYEFNIANNGLYDILYGEVNSNGDIGYYTITNGGSNDIKQGQNVNEYSISCVGDKLTLTINGREVNSITERNYALREGQVGVSVSSFDVLPIQIEMDWFKISEP